MMDSVVILIEPHISGNTFTVIVGELTQADPALERYELTILHRRDGIQGDMVLERLEDVTAPWTRKLANRLESTLKKSRQSAK